MDFGLTMRFKQSWTGYDDTMGVRQRLIFNATEMGTVEAEVLGFSFCFGIPLFFTLVYLMIQLTRPDRGGRIDKAYLLTSIQTRTVTRPRQTSLMPRARDGWTRAPHDRQRRTWPVRPHRIEFPKTGCVRCLPEAALS